MRKLLILLVLVTLCRFAMAQQDAGLSDAARGPETAAPGGGRKRLWQSSHQADCRDMENRFDGAKMNADVIEQYKATLSPDLLRAQREEAAKMLNETKDMLDQCRRRSQEAQQRDRVKEETRANARDAERMREAEQRAADEKAADEYARLVARTMSSPQNVRAAYSICICWAGRKRAGAIAEIARERHYARYGGMVRKDKLYDLQMVIRAADEYAAEKRAQLKAKSLSPLNCSSNAVSNASDIVSEVAGADQAPAVLEDFHEETDSGSASP